MSPKKADTQPPMPGAIWLRQRPPVRARGSLDRESISRAAVELLDQGGAAALSLRALAGRLGVHATSLYWHVAHRDDLLDLAVDAVFGEITEPSETTGPGRPGDGRAEGDWRADVAGFIHGLRAALLRHPWSGALASSRPLLGPEALARSELVYASLHQAGFTGPALTAAAAAISNLVIGGVAAETAWAQQGEADARHAMHHHLRANAERYPTLAALPDTTTDTWTEQFERATDALLRGLQAQLSEPD